MKRAHLILAATVISGVGCASLSLPGAVYTAKLQCPYAKEGGFLGLFSFTFGALAPPIRDANAVDLVYYFDGDDCTQGALIGNDDCPGYLFLIGHKSWDELAKLEPPPPGAESVAAIAPLTKDKEGLAFWVKRGSGEYLLARIEHVHSAAYEDLARGRLPCLELEWRHP